MNTLSSLPQLKPRPPILESEVLESGSVELSKMKGKQKKSTAKEAVHKKRKKILGIITATLAVMVLFFTVFVVVPGYRVYKEFLDLKESALRAKASVETQDISVVKAEVQRFKTDLSDFQTKYQAFSWVRGLPGIGVYYRDGQAGVAAGLHAIDAAGIVIETAQPYADIIGFAGPNSQVEDPLADTANDRIDFLIQTVEDVLPRIDELSQKALLVKTEVDKIDPNRYPEDFRGIKVRDLLKDGIALVDEATVRISQSKPLLESVPYLIGKDEPRTYLLMFQNDKELRPTGGFMTAYAIMNVTNGKPQPVSSNDIYNLDNKYSPRIAAPEAIIKYLKGPYLISRNLRLRDMNWSPDFEESMNLFSEEAKRAGITEIDGIISVDTEVVVKLLNVIGPVDVPGFGTFSTQNDERCDCPQIIYELESYADIEGPVVWSQDNPDEIIFAPSNYGNRKDIIGPLMNTILSHALGQPKEKLPDLFQAAWESVTEKHALFYFLDEKAQEGANGFNIAGRIQEYEGDYLHINDANLGGRKSNLYVTQEVSQIIDVSGDGTVTKTLTITYKNTQDYDGWLNSVLPNWTRIYVPQGSELVDIQGFEDPGETYEELGKTVFSGGFELRPLGVKQIVVTYKLPMKFENSYNIYIQKQAGTADPLYTIEVKNDIEEMFLKTDREFSFNI